MKLKAIEEIATKQVPVWQPVLLITLLLAGFIAVPLITKNTPSVEKKKESGGAALGINTIKEQLNNAQNSAKPLVDQLANQVQKEAGIVLGLAQNAVQQTVQNVATQGASQASEFVLDNTLGKLLQNINSLSPDQQSYIKKAICK